MGVISRQNQVELSVLQNMQQILRHRGPDDSGLECLEIGGQSGNPLYAGVAFDRLSIRDLSTHGHQPMWSNNHDVMIAFNGEIYNSEELRPQLISRGVSFVGNSDTEVLLNMYLQYGLEDTLRQLDGMFAICIVDNCKQKIYLVRDRIGEKPLYIYKKDHLLLFASEYKAFYCHPQFKAELNEDAVSEYFAFRYPVCEMTFLKGVENLTPGSYLEISIDEVQKRTYWTIPAIHENKLSFEDNKKHVKELIEKSVRRRLISDRPIGIQLSGGVDSSYLCAVVKNDLGKDLKTYCITFDDKETSEEKYIDIVNQHLGLKTYKLQFEPEDLLGWWEKSIWHFEAPMNHEGTIPLCQLNNIAAKEVTVMLCGDGPDECMGGYPRLLQIAKFCRNWHGFRWPFTQLKAWYYHKPHYSSIDEQYLSRTQFLKDEEIRQLRPETYKEDLKKAYSRRLAILKKCGHGNKVRKYLTFEMTTYMQDILMRTDKASMASSLEIRVPYLMPELLEFLQTIPEQQLIDYTKQFMYGTKVVLKELCADVFGKDFAYRPKFGLGLPMEKFWRQPKVRDYVETTLLPSVKKRKIVNYNYVLKLWNSVPEIASCNDSRLQVLWTVFSFEIWAQMYIDNSPVSTLLEK